MHLDTCKLFSQTICLVLTYFASWDKSLYVLRHARPPCNYYQKHLCCLTSWKPLVGILYNLSSESQRYERYNAPLDDAFSYCQGLSFLLEVWISFWALSSINAMSSFEDIVNCSTRLEVALDVDQLDCLRVCEEGIILKVTDSPFLVSPRQNAVCSERPYVESTLLAHISVWTRIPSAQ